MDYQLDAKIAAATLLNDHIGGVTVDDFVVISWCYILGSSKTFLAYDDDASHTFEVTYNPEKRERYINYYRKVQNVSISDDALFDIRKKLGGNSR